jgi:alpha-L-fucosidase
MKRSFLLLLMISVMATLAAQDEEERYVPETDPLVLQKLEEWQDMKFGLLMHWGPYSQWGIVESWSICSEDEGWCRRKNPDYIEYKKQYEALKLSFNPVSFNPEKWAAAARNAGMKYVIFTTKHHDGFSMFDTKLTDYRITDTECPFSVNPRANVTKEIFDAFRKEGFRTGAYFSKPDWHSEYYWWPNFATPDRNVNYSIKNYPERWEKFVEFTQGQIMELLGGDYGRVDILWLDGGWVRKMSDEQVMRYRMSSVDNYVRVQSQDIRMDELVEKAREIVVKGGNLLLNIGPAPDGTWPEGAYNLLEEIGEWMDINGEAIYGTRAMAPYKDGKVCINRKGDNTWYLFYMAEEGEEMPVSVTMNGLAIPAGAKVTMLGTGRRCRWKNGTDGFTVFTSGQANKNTPADYVMVMKIEI